METAAVKYMNFIGGNYQRLKDNMMRYCAAKHTVYDEDVFGDTVMKVYEKILKDGMEDDSDRGFESYFFMSFKTNMMREKQYSRNKQADDNVSQDDIGDMYDRYYNDANDSALVKLTKDLKIDFKTLKILLLVEKHFSSEEYYLFKLKHLEGLTYKQLAERTGVKDCRNKVLTVLSWLREHAEEIDKEIESEFQEDYGDWLEFN